jgi:hypothetical protein
VTGTTRLRSRVKGNFHARFCSSGGGSDLLVDCNRTGGTVAVRTLLVQTRVGGGFVARR